MYVLCAQILDAHVLDAHELKKMLVEKEERRAIYVYIYVMCVAVMTIAVIGCYWDMYGHLHVN